MCCRLHVHPSLLRLSLTAAYRTGKSVAKLQAHTDKICCESHRSRWHTAQIAKTRTQMPQSVLVYVLLMILSSSTLAADRTVSNGILDPYWTQKSMQWTAMLPKSTVKVLGRYHLVVSGESFFTGNIRQQWLRNPQCYSLHCTIFYHTLRKTYRLQYSSNQWSSNQCLSKVNRSLNFYSCSVVADQNFAAGCCK